MFSQMRSRNGNLTYSVEVFPTLAEVQTAVLSNPYGVGMGAITTTAERSQDFDFSQSYFAAGLDVLVLRQSQTPNIMLIFEPFDWFIWVSATALLFFSGHVFWFFERDYQPSVFPHPYLKGVNEGIWYAYGTLAKIKAVRLSSLPIPPSPPLPPHPSPPHPTDTHTYI